MSTPAEAPLLKDIAADRNEAATRQTALDAERQTSSTEREGVLQPMEAGVNKEIASLGTLKPPPVTPLPEWKPQPLIDSKDYQQLSMGLIGMSLIAGIASRGNWMGVSSTLNGALKGYYDGNQEAAERRYKDYQTQFKEAQQKSQQQQKEFEDILQNKRLSINDMLTQIKIAAAKYGRDDVRMEAEQKSIDGVWKRVETMDATLARLSDMDQRQQAGFDAMFKRDQQRLKGASADLDENGQWVTEQMALGGNFKPLHELQSRFGGEMAAQMYNAIGAQLKANGQDPRTLTESQLNLLVQKTAQSQATNREQAVGRLTESLTKLEGEAKRLVTKVNGEGMTTANATFNAISSQFGDQDLQELKTLMGSMGRQYIEAVTMPGSNAQLHASASAWADEKFDPNTNLSNLLGTFKAMNLEIGATREALTHQIKQSQGIVTGQGITLPVPGAAPAATPAPHQPFADPAKEQRYQEWKAKQGNAPAPTAQ
jgi:hypothetical protein